MAFVRSSLLILLISANAVPSDALLLREQQDPAASPAAAAAGPIGPAVPRLVDQGARTEKFDDIQKMRAGLCEKRLHGAKRSEKCLKWFAKVCKTTTSGTGTCQRFWNHLKTSCLTNAKDPSYQQECELAQELGIDVSTAGAPSPAASPASSPAGSPAAALPMAPAAAAATTTATTTAAAPAPAKPGEPEQITYSKFVTPLPDQGFHESSWGRVEYDGKTNFNKDWQKEHHVDPKAKVKDICGENSDNEWCKRNHPVAKVPFVGM